MRGAGRFPASIAAGSTGSNGKIIRGAIVRDSTATTSNASRPNSESMERRMSLAIRHEHIAAASDGPNEPRDGRIGFEDAAQTPHLHIDAAVGAVVFRFVQQVEQALARERTHRVADKDLE